MVPSTGHGRPELREEADASQAKRVLVVGYGPIGHAFVEHLVELAMVPVQITVLCEEPWPAYNRVAMTSFFQHQSASELMLCNPDWWLEQNISLIFARATRIDRERQCVFYGDAGADQMLPYDELVLATGSAPFVPPVPGINFSMPGMYTYRTIEDMRRIIDRAQGCRRAAVIGGGLLGLEAAKALVDLKLEVHVLEAAPHLMPAQLDHLGGGLLARKVSAMGVTVHTGVKVLEVLWGESGVRFLRLLQDGVEQWLDTDMLVVSCGVRPRDELARDCGLELGASGSGVKVDSRMRSVSDEHVHAIGEVASVNGCMIYGLWKPGTEQAEVLASVLSGSPHLAGTVYRGSDMSTKLKLLGVDVASFGGSTDFWQSRLFAMSEEEGAKHGLCIMSALDSAAGSYRKLVFRRCAGGARQLLGGLLVSRTEDFQMLRNLSMSGRDLWGMEHVVLAHGPGATPGQIEAQVYPTQPPAVGLGNARPISAVGLRAERSRRVVVVGYGPVGHAFVEQLLSTSERPVVVTVFCEEPWLAYSRVAMTSFFQHRSASDLLLSSHEWLDANNVQLIPAAATAIDRAERRVLYGDDDSPSFVDYDELVLATGSAPFVPPVLGLRVGEVPGIFTYRTIEDMNAIIRWASGRRTAAVIGGGLLGLEAAKALLDLGLETHVLELAPYLMSAQLDSNAGELLQRKVAALGVSVHTGVKILEVVSAADGVCGVRLLEDGHDQRLDVDLLIVSCGVRPRDELARNADLELGVRGGVKVNCHLRSTSDEHVYAIGEVASYNGGMVYGLWKPGLEQAEVLAGTIGSPSHSLQYHGSDLSTKLKLLGVDVASFGGSASFWHDRLLDLTEKDGEKHGLCVMSTLDPPSGSYRKLVFARLSGGGRRLLGGVLVGSVGDFQMLRDLACSGRELWNLEQMVLLQGPGAAPGQIEAQVYPTRARL